MKILLLSQYFPPEVGALAARSYENTKRWVKEGHHVTVISETPNYPSGEVYKGYNNKLIYREDKEGIEVRRSWVIPTSYQRTWKRIVNYISYGVSSFFASFSTSPDLVIGSSPQPLTALSAYFISRIKKALFVLEVRDLWPESLQAKNETKGIIFKILSKLFAFLYRKADLIVVNSPSFKNKIKEKGFNKDKIKYIPNGVDLKKFSPSLVKKGLRELERYSLKDKFVVSYIGIIGEAHGLEIIIKAAKQLIEENVLFLLVGDGSQKKYLEDLKKENNLDNVIFTGCQPSSKIPAFLKISDVSIIHLKQKDVFKTVIPSKMFESMAMANPIILGVEGEAKRILEKTNAGLSIKPESSKQMVRAIHKFYSNKTLIKKLGDNGRDYMKNNFNRDRLAKNYLNILRKIEPN